MRLRALAVAAALFFAPAALAGTVGLVLPLSGPEARLGSDLRDGALLARDALGTGVEVPRLEVRDDRGQDRELELALRDLAKDPAVGVVLAGGSAGQNRLLERWVGQLPFTTMVVGDPGHTGSPLAPARTKRFQLLPSNVEQLQAMQRAMGDGRGAVVLMPSAKDAVPDVRDALALSGNAPVVVAPAGRPSAAELVPLQAAAGVMLLGTDAEVVAAGEELRRAGLTCPLYVRLRQCTEDFRALAGARLDPVLAVSAAGHVGRAPGHPDFRRRFRERFGRDPSPWAALGYDGLTLAAEALTRSRGRPEAVGDALVALPPRVGVGFGLVPAGHDPWLPALARLTPGGFQIERLPQRTSPAAPVEPATGAAPAAPGGADQLILRWRSFPVLPGN